MLIDIVATVMDKEYELLDFFINLKGGKQK